MARKTRMLKKHKDFLEQLYPNCDILSILEDNGYTEDDLNDWKERIIGFDSKFYVAIDITKTQERFLKAFRKKMCNVSATCRAIKIHRGTVYKWRGKSDTFKKEMDNVEESLYDDVESKMHNEIFVKDNPSMMMFYAKTKMKHRGYVEKVENTNINVDATGLDKMSDEELLAIVNGKQK